jgi:hypothetical protein
VERARGLREEMEWNTVRLQVMSIERYRNETFRELHRPKEEARKKAWWRGSEYACVRQKKT